MTPESIIEKIKSLLRLAKSSNPHEAGLALQRAMELADKWHVDLAALGDGDDSSRLVHDHLPVPARLAREWRRALNITVHFFNVYIIVRSCRTKVLITGTALDIELAQYIITFLVRQCRAAVADWRKIEKRARRKTTGPKVACFVDGFFLGIQAQLDAQRQVNQDSNPGLSLILATGHDQREAAAKALIDTKLTTVVIPVSKRDLRSLGAGYRDGLATTIRPGLKGNPLPQLL